MNNRIGDNLEHFGSNRELVRAMSDAGVSFVVVGGLAVAWHCTERQADDMDLLVEPTAGNSERISRVLTSLGISGHSAESFNRLGLQVPVKSIYYADLLTPQKGYASFSEIEGAAVDARLFNIPVRLASIPTLIAMKKQAIASAQDEREKHQTDIALLQTRAA